MAPKPMGWLTNFPAAMCKMSIFQSSVVQSYIANNKKGKISHEMIKKDA
jgi:hypothetical protein